MLDRTSPAAIRHIAVIGAGITGVTTAYALIEKGYAVTVFDRHRYAAMETSFANGGQLSASNAEVWNHWSTVWKGMAWMLKRDAPLLVNPTPSWHKLSWFAEFVGNIRNYRANTIATARLAIAARRHLFEIAAREGIAFDLERRGILHVYRDRAGFEHAAQVNALLTAAGLDRQAVTPEEMRTIEPALHGRYFGGFFTPSDATGDIHKFTRGLAQACERRGVRFVLDADVTRLAHRQHGIEIAWSPTIRDAGAGHDLSTDHDVSTYDGVVICAGVASRALAAMLGDRVNIYPVKGYSITVDLGDDTSRKAAPWVSLLDDEAKIVTSRLGPQQLRVAGTAEFNGYNRDIRDDRIRPLVDWTRNLFPAVDTERVVPWSGLRPMLPSMMPRVGAGRHPGVFYNTGHGHLGWTLSAATARMIADTVAAALPVEPRTVVSRRPREAGGMPREPADRLIA
jgi:D-amino-acid dehydrogenase